MLSQMIRFPSFLIASTIPLCKYTTVFLSTHLLMGTWAAVITGTPPARPPFNTRLCMTSCYLSLDWVCVAQMVILRLTHLLSLNFVPWRVLKCYRIMTYWCLRCMKVIISNERRRAENCHFFKRLDLWEYKTIYIMNSFRRAWERQSCNVIREEEILCGRMLKT